MLKTVILDCDGVMFDSLNANRHYYNFLLRSFGCPEMGESELEYVHIHSVYESVTHLFHNYPEVDTQQVHQFRRENSYLPFLKYMTIEPHLVDFLEIAQERYNLGIATNRTDTMMSLLKEFQIEHYFGKVMTADNARRPKPAADPLQEICEHFQCQVEEAIYIGDSSVDEETAANCGMRLIGFNNPALNADYHITSFSEILALPPFQSQ